MIDYLQLMTAPSSSESRQVGVGDQPRREGAGAGLNIPVICLSQLNRATGNARASAPHERHAIGLH